jgi:hypothetical protein
MSILTSSYNATALTTLIDVCAKQFIDLSLTSHDDKFDNLYVISEVTRDKIECMQIQLIELDNNKIKVQFNLLLHNKVTNPDKNPRKQNYYFNYCDYTVDQKDTATLREIFVMALNLVSSYSCMKIHNKKHKNNKKY